MSLPIDLVQEFAKSTFDPGNKIKETDCYGTAQNVDGNWFVQLDGSSELTPATPTTGVTSGDRVLVRIRNRKAVIIGNITNPIIITGILQANTGIVVKGYLTTNENRTTYNDQNNFGLTFSSGGMGSYGGNNKYWYVTAAGDLYANSAQIVGNITAKSGYLGTAESGFTIDPTGIYTGIKGIPGTGYVLLSAADVSRTLAGKAVTNARLAVGPNFGVTSDGTVYATGATITGTITATSGYIGNATNGFKIDASGFYSGANKTGNSTGYITLSNSDFTRTIGTTARSQLRLAIGSGFAVTSTGKLYANGADITGDIHATSLDLGSQKIPKANLDLPEDQDLSMYIYIDANGKIQMPKDGTIGTPAAGSKGFRIAKDGLLTASNAVIYGTIYASAGSIGGLTLANNVLYSNGHSAWNAANTNGVYIGADHIALGPGGKFNVTDAGVLTATGATISGAITATSLTLGANVKVPYSSVSGTPNLTVYIAKDGTIGTVASGSTGFTVSSAGLLQASNAVVYGKLYSSEGTIGGLTLKSNALYSNGHSAWNTANVNGVYVGTDYIALGPGGKFNVTNAGVLTATGVNISGTVTATGGKIGNFNIGTALYSGSKSSFSSTTSGVYVGTDGIAFGQNNLFNVTSAGKLTANDAEIKGKITANSGKIGAFNLTSAGSLYTGSKSTLASTASGFYIGSDGLSIGTNQFKVEASTGKLTATNADIKGAIHATSLTLDNKIPASNISGLPAQQDLSLYVKKDGTIGSTPADGATGFKVSSAGLLQASNAVIYGKLYSSVGTIGGFTLGSGKLYTNDHSAYNTAKDGVYIGADYLSFGSGGKFYIDKSGVVYCNGGTVYFNFATASGTRVTAQSNLIFRIDKSTDVGGVGYNISYVTSGASTIYYGDLYLYTAGSNKNLYIKTYNNLHLKAATVYVGNTSADANIYGNSAATSSVTISASSYVSFWTDKINLLKNLELRRNGSAPQLILASAAANTSFRLDGYTTVELGIGLPPNSQTSGVVPSPTVEFSMYASGVTYGLYYHVLNGTGSKWILYTTHSATSLICTPTLTVEGGLNISGGHVVAKPPSNKATEERAFVSENNYGRIHCTVSGGTMGLWVRGYTNHDGSTQNYATWLIYMKYNDSSYVYTDKPIKANGTVLTGSSSDIRLKEKIEETEIISGLSLINKIHLHSFTWKHAYNNEYAGNRWKIGMIADEIEELDPTLTLGGGWEDEAHTIIDKKSINVFYLQGYIVKSIQELSGMSESHEERIKRLEAENKELKHELLKLKGAS